MLARFIAGLIPQHIEALLKNAREDGMRCALAEIAAEEVRRKKIENPFLVGSDPTLYGPQKFKVTTELEAKMREEVALAVQNGWVSPPTQDQWQMILSDNPATCVVAGAGSGKSTTLILRVVFMICHLKLSPETIMVVSFTVKSCVELRRKLFETFQHEQWKSQVPERYAADLEKNCDALVSTFHSALSRVARKEFPKFGWFDMLGNEKQSRRTVEENDDGEEPIDNPFASNGLTQNQLDLIEKAYNQCFSNDELFQKHVARLLEISIRQLEILPNSKKEPTATQSRDLFGAAQKDLELIERINKKWEATKWLPSCIDIGPYPVFKEGKHTFYANGRLKDSGTPVFLSIDGRMGRNFLFDKDELIGKETGYPLPINRALERKKNIVAYYIRGSCLYINTKEACDLFKMQSDRRDSTGYPSKNAPNFDILIHCCPVDFKGGSIG